jgi:hypothetical protein
VHVTWEYSYTRALGLFVGRRISGFGLWLRLRLRFRLRLRLWLRFRFRFVVDLVLRSFVAWDRPSIYIVEVVPS